jgi:hypothetical protein
MKLAPLQSIELHPLAQTNSGAAYRIGENQVSVSLQCEISTRLTSEMGLVTRVSPVQTALRNRTRDEERSFEVGNQVSSYRKLLLSKAMVVNVAETLGRVSDRQGGEKQ